MGEKWANFGPRAGVVSTALYFSHAVNLVGELNELVGDRGGRSWSLQEAFVVLEISLIRLSALAPAKFWGWGAHGPSGIRGHA